MGRLSALVAALFRRRPMAAATVDAGYRAYTMRHDMVVEADRLDGAIGPLPEALVADFAAARETFRNGLIEWRVRTGMASLDATSALRGSVSGETLRDTVVTLLIDHSGSMRGRRMLIAAAIAEIATAMLVELGVAVEVLGFTTRSWKGGNSRRDWISAGRPRDPGRLCDLLHVVYRSADTRGGVSLGTYGQMLRPDLLKENIDGEAVEWALQRLGSVARGRRILVVVSDGAPVDDSTLSSNANPSMLVDHLMTVLARARTEATVDVAAVGIGYSVHCYYENSVKVETPEEIGPAVMSLLTACLAKPAG